MSGSSISSNQSQSVEKRVRYFDGQSLKTKDYADEQKYHIDRQRRHNRTLHISGICDGLIVQKKDAQIIVNAGTGLNSKGQQIVLGKDSPIENLENYKNQVVKLVISYQELESDQSTKEGGHGNTRLHEKPKVQVLTESDQVPDECIFLAKLKIDSNGKVEEVDNTVRQYSGVYLPAGDGKGVILRTHGDDNPNLAVLTGSLSISGTLEVKGESTLTGNVNAKGSLTVTGTTQLDSTLTVNEKTTLQKDLSVSGNLTSKNITAEETVTAKAFVGNGAVIKGMILMWSGAIKDIPKSWALCDGTNGTPDLRERFIVGAKSDENSEYKAGNKGEPDTHNHQVKINAKSLKTSEEGEHSHEFPGWYGRSVKAPETDIDTIHTNTFRDDIHLGQFSLVDCNGKFINNTKLKGKHNHTVEVAFESIASEPSSGQNRPKWYALCFIMKL